MVVAMKTKSGKKTAVKDVNVIAILDMSGSMSGKEQDTRGGFNAFVKDAQDDQAKEGGKVTLSLTCFDTEFIKVFRPTEIQRVKPIGPEEYTPRGNTALLDAIGKAIAEQHFPKDEKVLVYIVTDGKENSSREWTNAKVKALIEEKEAAGWEFLFIGAGLDAWDASKAFASVAMAGNTVSANASGPAFRAASARASSSSYHALRSGRSVRSAVDDLYGSDDDTFINRSIARRTGPSATSTTSTTPVAPKAEKPSLRKLRRS